MPESEQTVNLRLESIQPSNQALNQFPVELANLYTMVPLGTRQGVLELAGPNRLSAALQKQIQTQLRLPVRAYLCTWHEYRHFYEKCYGVSSDEFQIHPEQRRKIFENSASFSNVIAEPGTDIRTEEQLENTALVYHLPKLSANTLYFGKGFDQLLPPSISADTILPFGWSEGTLYCMIKDVQWLPQFELINQTTDFFCQPVLTLGSIFDQTYQRYILRGPIKKSGPSAEIIEELIAHRKLRREQGNYALQIEKQSGKSARQVLLAQKLIRRDDWLKTRADMLGVIPLTEKDIPHDFERILTTAKNLIPDWLVRAFRILPILVEDGVLLAGFEEMDFRLVELAESITHLQIDARLMDEDELDAWIEKVYPEQEPHYAEEHFSEFLLRFGFLTREQYDGLMLSGNRDQKFDLGVVRSSGVLSEYDLAEALGYFTGYPVLGLDHFNFDEALIRRFPAELLQETRHLPLFEGEKDVWIAISDPFQTADILKMEAYSGKHVWPVIVPHETLNQIIQRFCAPYEPSVPEVRLQSLVDYLVAEKVLTRQQSMTVLQACREENLALDEAILQHTDLEAGRLARAIAAYHRVRYEDLSLGEEVNRVIDALGVSRLRASSVEPVEAEAANLLLLEIAEELCALPVRFQGESLVVAFGEPHFQQALEQVKQILQKPVIPVFAERQTLSDAITRILGRPKLGSVLLSAGMVTRRQLNDALEYAARANIRLGRALVFKRYITEEALYQFLAQQANLPYFDLSAAEIDADVARLLDARFEREAGVLPLSIDENFVLLATVDPHNQVAFEEVHENFEKEIRLAVVSETDFENALEQLYSREYLNESVSALLERAPEDSAFRVLGKGQQIGLVLLLIATVALLIWNASTTFIVMNALITAFYLIFSVYKFRLIFSAISSNLEVPVSEEDLSQLKDAELPVYTILVPVHREAEVLPEIVKSLASMDYPDARLDILVLLEEDDEETIDKFDEINPPRFIKKIIVPNQLPRTKPKACNYGLIHARGDYVVIYDAEDLPDRDQLKRVVVAFAKTPENVVCIQAKLNYFNRNQNILTKWFTVEYSMWFDLLLPGLDAQNAPIPLGGTSNHFKTRALLEAGAWDPYNVTEDADLGIRLFKRGYRTRIIDSTTYEEANSQFGNWIRQRSRWLKGYMQTWLVHMRHPLRLIKDIGFKNFMSFQYIVGGTFLTALLNPFYWFLTALWFIAEPAFIQKLFPGVVFFMGAICLYIGTFVFTYINVAGAMRRGYYDMVRTAMLSPIYWAMSSIASWKGFVQLIFKPHFWEKTQHGLYQKEVVPEEGDAEGQAA
jgi:glycosyltransferase XagB